MCRHAYWGHHRGHRMGDVQNFFVAVVAMIREAAAVLANARRDLEDIANGNTRATTVGSDIKTAETNLNVPL